MTAYILLSCNFIKQNKKLPEDEALDSKHVGVLNETDNLFIVNLQYISVDTTILWYIYLTSV